jgi:hypothetical protein
MRLLLLSFNKKIPSPFYRALKNSGTLIFFGFLFFTIILVCEEWFSWSFHTYTTLIIHEVCKRMMLVFDCAVRINYTIKEESNFTLGAYSFN